MNTNLYIADLLGQPVALQDTLADLLKLPDLRHLSRRLTDGDYRRVVLTGMGSSYHALHPLWLKLIAGGMTAFQIETSELIHSAPGLLDEKTFVVAVSQSGRSAEILRLLEKQYGGLLCVTNSDDSPLALQAEAAILTRAGEESTVSCKTYVTALAALEVLGQVLLGEAPQHSLDDLSPVPEVMADYLENWRRHVSELLEQLDGVQALMLAGRGASLAAVSTGALIIKEAAHFPAEGMSSATLRHGPLNMASPRLFVLVYEGGSKTGSLNTRLAEDIRTTGGKVQLVHFAEDNGVFSLPSISESALPLVEILPAQMLSLACAQLTGWEAGEFRHGFKVTEIE